MLWETFTAFILFFFVFKQPKDETRMITWMCGVK